MLQGEWQGLCGSVVVGNVSAHGSGVVGADAATGEDLLDASPRRRKDESCWQPTVATMRADPCTTTAGTAALRPMVRRS